jgi:hypothetical protein
MSLIAPSLAGTGAGGIRKRHDSDGGLAAACG